MVIECPNCGALPSQGTNYEKLLRAAEAGTMLCSCAGCDYVWIPSAAEHQLLIANLRKLVAKSTA
jgi:hypothetical protein